MSSAFSLEQKHSQKTTQNEGPKRAADIVSNESGLSSALARSEPSKEPAALSTGPSQDKIVNLEGRCRSYIYIPVTLPKADEVWERVVTAFRCMDSADFNEVEDEGDEKSYDCYSLKYLYDKFVLARTRLVRLEEDGEQIYIELRKLEGDGFAFTDDFQRHLETQLEDITKPDGRPEPQSRHEREYLDLADEASEEILSKWFTDLRPTSSGNTLVYNKIETYNAMSSLGWNISSPENFEVLKEHGETIIGCSLNILNATSHLPTAYFAALTLNEFAKKKQFDADWGHIKIMSGAIVNWSDETGGEFAKMQVSRSREVVRLLSNTLLEVGPNLSFEGKARAEGNIVAMLEKLEELSHSEDYAGFIDVKATAQALSM